MKQKPNAAAQDPRHNYLGMLFPTEQYRVYGYITSTNVKLVLVLNDQSNAKDPEIKSVRLRV